MPTPVANQATVARPSPVNLLAYALHRAPANADLVAPRALPSPFASQAPADLAALVLEAVPVGVLVLHQDGSVVHANEAAHALLAGPCGLAIRDGHLVAADFSGQCELTSAVSQAARGLATARHRCVRLRGEDGRGVVVRVGHLACDQRSRALAVATLTVTLPPGPTALQASELLADYGLTPAEARVAMAIACGKIPKVIAREFSVTLHTIRTHLRCIYAKVGVRNVNGLITTLHARDGQAD
jgi:DNA-binding CsgD family transcriptional regulator